MTEAVGQGWADGASIMARADHEQEPGHNLSILAVICRLLIASGRRRRRLQRVDSSY